MESSARLCAAENPILRRVAELVRLRGGLAERGCAELPFRSIKMGKALLLAAATAVALSACGKSERTPSSTPVGRSGAPANGGEPAAGDGPTTPRGGAAAGGRGATVDCDGLPPECCESNVAPCGNLNETDCVHGSHCKPIHGTKWKIGDDPFARGGAPTYLYCQSICDDHSGEDTPFCVFEPSEPTACFLVDSESSVPDGWANFIECEDVPEGACVD